VKCAATDCIRCRFQRSATAVLLPVCGFTLQQRLLCLLPLLLCGRWSELGPAGEYWMVLEGRRCCLHPAGRPKGQKKGREEWATKKDPPHNQQPRLEPSKTHHVAAGPNMARFSSLLQGVCCHDYVDAPCSSGRVLGLEVGAAPSAPPPSTPDTQPPGPKAVGDPGHSAAQPGDVADPAQLQEQLLDLLRPVSDELRFLHKLVQAKVCAFMHALALLLRAHPPHPLPLLQVPVKAWQSCSRLAQAATPHPIHPCPCPCPCPCLVLRCSTTLPKSGTNPTEVGPK
jgi:hypothetical protein